MKNHQLSLPEEIIYNRDGKGKKEIMEVKIHIPDTMKKTDTQYQKRQKRRKFRLRAEIEPVVGHLKTDFRPARNYLYGTKGIQINAMLSATVWYLKKMMEIPVEEVKRLFLAVFFPISFFQKIYISRSLDGYW